MSDAIIYHGQNSSNLLMLPPWFGAPIHRMHTPALRTSGVVRLASGRCASVSAVSMHTDMTFGTLADAYRGRFPKYAAYAPSPPRASAAIRKSFDGERAVADVGTVSFAAGSAAALTARRLCAEAWLSVSEHEESSTVRVHPSHPLHTCTRNRSAPTMLCM